MVILSPSITFGIILATLYGAATHLALGGSGRRLLAYIAASWVGFALGQAIGDVLDFHALAIGPTNLLSASFGAFIALAITAVLTARQPGDTP